MVAEDAVYCAVVGSKGSAVLEIHFAAFRDIPSVTDEYAVCKRLENRQSDWSHILHKAEKWEIYGDGSDFVLYMRLLGMYHEIKSGTRPTRRPSGYWRTRCCRLPWSTARDTRCTPSCSTPCPPRSPFSG